MLAVLPPPLVDAADRLAAGAARVAVVIPAFRVRAQLPAVVGAIGPEVDLIYVVDDACPEQSGEHLLDRCGDPRVQVLVHRENQGVGGAVMTGGG